MSQHDYVIGNDTAANVRADINLVLGAIATSNRGATAPTTTYANMFWYDTTTNILKMRNSANSAWISLADFSTGDAVWTNTSLSVIGTGVISANSGTDALRITQTGAGNALLVEDSANPDSTPFVITATGNVGIGTSAPAAPLNIVGNNFPLRFTGAAGGGAGGIEFYSDAGVTQATFDVNDTLQRVIVSVDPNNAWSNAGKVHLATSGSNRLSIDGNGLIGIGTLSPATALNISGTTNGTGSGTACSISGNTLTVGGTVTGTWAVGDRVFGSGVDFNTVITALGTGTGGAGTYTLNNSMTVASTTMYAIAASRNVLRFTNTDTTELAGQPEGGIEFYGSDASTPGAGVKGYIATIAESGTPDTAMVFGTSGNVASTQALERFRIASAGQLGIGGANYGTAGQVLTSGGSSAAVTWGTIPLTAGYVSSQQTITSAGLLTLAHGLGAQPKLVLLEIVCQTAESNFSVGDVVLVGVNATSTASNRHTTVYYDSTNINVRFSSTTGVFTVANRTTGASETLTNANWKLRVRAFA